MIMYRLIVTFWAICVGVSVDVHREEVCVLHKLKHLKKILISL